ncbi:MAG TPA: N-acetyltransferase, partial [Magnetococcales bacterium]|nr:N-acetyltransferase [Magnetococcales bacterium]
NNHKIVNEAQIPDKETAPKRPFLDTPPQPYSVFNQNELNDFYERKKYPYLIRFTYNFALKKRIIRGDLLEKAGLDEGKYWGFMELTNDQFACITKLGQIDKGLVVN